MTKNSQEIAIMEMSGDEVQQIDINFENIYYTVTVPKQKGENGI